MQNIAISFIFTMTVIEGVLVTFVDIKLLIFVDAVYITVIIL